MATVTKKNTRQAIVSQKDINLVLRIIKSNWWIPLIIVPIFYAIGNFYVYRLTDIYQASTEFLLKNNDVFDEKSVLTGDNFYSAGNTYIDNTNQIRVIKSYDMAGKIVDKLWQKLQVSYYIVGKVRTTEIFNELPFSIDVNAASSIISEQIIDFKIINTNQYQLEYSKDGTTVTKTGTFGEDLIDTDFNFNIKWSGFFIPTNISNYKVIFYQFKLNSKEEIIQKLRSELIVENPEFTNILSLKLTDVIPERAVLILDTLCNIFSQSKLKSRFDINDRTIEYIDKQSNELLFSLKSIQDTMANYKQKKSIINLDWQQTDFLGKISQYDGQRSQLQLQLNGLNDLEKYIIEDKDPVFLPPNAYIIEKAGFLNQAITELYTKQLDLNRLLSSAKDDNPLVKDLKGSLKRVKQDLLLYINNTRKAVKQQSDNVNAEIVKYISQAKQIPSEQQDVINIQRRTAVNEKLYEYLLEKKASTKIAKASIVSDVKIVEKPRSLGVSTPDKPKLKKQFLSTGILFSLLIIFTRSLFYQKIKTVDHLKDLTDLPLIGVLPYIKNVDNESIVVDQSPNSVIAESFRNFRTNLQYANVGLNNKSFIVTSFMPGEGKTFTSVNLATVLAKSGKKTVILELDLHKPRVYKRFGLPPQLTGITTYINGDSSYEDLISKTHIPNLYCMYSGPVPPNPSELVLSEKMKKLIAKAKEEFDFVVIDTQPAGLLSYSVYLI